MTISEKIAREQKRLNKAISLLKFATADVVYTTNRIAELSAKEIKWQLVLKKEY